MGLDKIIGQKRVKEILSRAFRNQRLTHAFLFHGPEGVGKEAAALELAKMILCTHPDAAPCGDCSQCHKVAGLNHSDVMYIFPAMKSTKTEEEREVLDSVVADPYFRYRPWAAPTISIDKIRELRRVSAIKSFEGRGRVIIIAEAEKMTTEASNAVLKILEEPSNKMTLILTALNKESLLPTIISRCQEIKFSYLSDTEIEQALLLRSQVPAGQASFLARIAFGSYRRALEWLHEDVMAKREKVVELLRDALVKDDLALLNLTDQLIEAKDKNYVKNMLSLTLIWLRDVMMLHHLQQQSPEFLINSDQKETLIRFLKAFRAIDFEPVIIEIETAIENIDRNIQLNLVLLALFYRLRNYFKR